MIDQATDLRPLRRRYNALPMRLRIHPPQPWDEHPMPWPRVLGVAVLLMLVLGVMGVWL